MPSSRFETVRLGEAPRSLERDDGALVCHINLARGYRSGERQTELLIRGLAQWRMRQRLIVRRGAPLAEHLGDLADLDLRAASGSLASVVRHTGAASLLHAHEDRAVQTAAFSARLRRTPYLLTRRVSDPLHNTRSTRRVYRRAAAVVAVSRAAAHTVTALDSNIECRVISDASSGLRSFPVSAARIRERFPDRFIVGNVAALLQQDQGQMGLLACAAELQRTHPQFQFVLVGSGPDEARMRAAAKDLHNVHFAGVVDNVGDYLAAFDAFVYPALRESLGSVLLDAMEFGLPIVATRAGGIPEIISDGDNGLLVEPDNADQLRYALLRLLNDKPLAQRLGSRGKVVAQAYSPDRMTEQYLDLSQALLGAADVIENL